MNLIDESVDNSLDAFNDLLLACLDDHAPIKTVKIRHKPNPFITEDIRDLMKVRDRLHKRARRTGMRKGWEVFKELRNRVKFVLRKAEREYYNQQIFENKNNSGAMWKTIRSALPNKSGRQALPRTQIHSLMNSIAFLYPWDRRPPMTLLSLLAFTTYQLLLFIAVQLTVMSCLTSKQ